MTPGASGDASPLSRDVWHPHGFVWWSSGCCSAVEGQSTKIFPRQSAVSALCPGGVREWRMENKTSKVHFTILAAVLGKHENCNDGVSNSLPVQLGFRNFGVLVSLARKGSWPLSWLLWPCGLAFGVFRCFKQDKL